MHVLENRHAQYRRVTKATNWSKRATNLYVAFGIDMDLIVAVELNE